MNGPRSLSQRVGALCPIIRPGQDEDAKGDAPQIVRRIGQLGEGVREGRE